MKRKLWLVGTLALCSLPATQARAEGASQLKACKEEFKKAGCMPKSAKEAYDCIEKIEKEGEKDEGLSHQCYVAHEAYEKAKGKEEGQGSEHQHEQ